MTMRKPVVSLLLLFTTSVPANADLSPQNFAEGFEIEMTNGSPIYRVRLPEQVYRTATTPDLRDLRVFNHDGSTVPHAVRRQAPEKTDHEYSTDLPMFPVYRDLARRDITVSDQGSILSIQQLDSIYVDPRAGIKHYIIDLSHLDNRVDELEFELSGIDAGFLGRARVESSEDLEHWRTVVANAALAVMHYADHQLIKNRIELPSRDYKYLRFTWLQRHDNLVIDSVRAMQSRSKTQREINWTTLAGMHPDSDKSIYEFDNASLLPVEQVELLLPEHNTLIDAVIRSRPDNEQSRWRNRAGGSFYRLTLQGVELDRGPLRVSPTTDRYWQLEVQTENGLGTKLPQLKVAWEANDVYFLARGEGPFLLAYGNANLTEAVKPVNALMQILNDPEKSELVDEAKIGNPVALMGSEALEADRVIPWERLLLWTVLALGVLVLGTMALRLFKQMNPS